MKSFREALLTFPLLLTFILTPALPLRAEEKEDSAKNAEIERRVNEELEKRQKSESASALLLRIYGYYSDNFIGQSTNLYEAEQMKGRAEADMLLGPVGIVVSGTAYGVGKADNHKGLKRFGKALGAASTALTVWGLHRNARESALVDSGAKFSKLNGKDSPFTGNLTTEERKTKMAALKRDINSGWNLERLLKKYSNSEQSIIYSNIYSNTHQEVEDILKGAGLKDTGTLSSNLAGERAVRRYLSLEAEPEVQKDIQKWLDLNAESIKDVARRITATEQLPTLHVSKSAIDSIPEAHTQEK